MDKNDILTLFDYNYWANQRLLEAAEKVAAEQYFAPAGLSHGSLHGTLVHTLAAEILWRQRCMEGISPTAIDEEFPIL